ncbi:MAG TPA: beta-ketoacyl synthase N-terminal-like domain-containing protein, partial [Kofleriaceae bacterium]|nr:beta-ketoacyl synthase N-terminal-like domain-containing protein [Kofleriaceae bacterium]
MNGSRERITLLNQPAPSLIRRLSPVTERVLATEAEAARAASQLETLLGRLLLAQLCAMGLFAAARGSITQWKQHVGLSPLYGRWLDETIRILTRRGYLEVEGDVCAVREASLLDETVPWFEWEDYRRTWSRDRDLRAQLNLADATVRALPAILSGREHATSVMFPDASMVLVESVYKHNAVADHFNAVLADIVVEYVRGRLAHDAGARLRILEIGAGTGGTTEGVIARLEPHSGALTEYCYTDVSHAFLLHAEQVYRPKARYLTCKLFNVEEPPQAQGIETGAYDVVIAANVLHATKQVRRTLRHAKATLRRNGILVLNEIAAPGVFTHLTFGLLEGWWLYEDEALRVPGTPALTGETWRRVLEGEGFQSVVFPAQAAHDRGHQIIVAESDGLVRQAPPRQVPPRTAQTNQVIAAAPASERPRETAVGGVGIDVLRKRATEALKKLLSDTIRTPLHRIDEAAALEIYGVDSLLVVKLTRGLRAFFPELSSTLFFEHRTLAGVAEHLLQTSEAAVRRWVGLELRPEPEPARLMNGHAPAVTIVEERAVVVAPAPSTQDGIAIIGMSGRYPGARNVREYWDNLKAGRSSIREIPAERWDHRRYYDPQKGKLGKSYSKWGGFIEDIDMCDPLFFRISPKEAEQMDPQERLFLQEAYASIEDAGYTPAGLCASRQVGVYVGVMNSTYQRHVAYWSIANRVSYLFDFHGPSMAVDTACSSSLTAIHLAVEAIQQGSCEMALAGGVHLIVDPVQYTNLSAATMLSMGDRCKAFGARADGFVDGEGVGTIVLKPLARAIADGDHIYGVIRGSAVNAGGKTNGYTVPNPTAQREVVEAALRKANVDARTVSYVEAHGTGTELGDPIEIAGLTQAFATQTSERQYCAIGSVKTNIGHLESAAGIAAVTKVLLQLQARTLVPSLHSEELNPHIDFTRTPFRVQQAVSEWQRPVVRVDGEAREYPRIAGVSSFGAGGGNAHVVIEEYCEAARPAASAMRHPAMIVLSAKSEAQLQAQARRLRAHVTGGDFDGELVDVAYTLQVGREAMDHRLAFTAGSLGELQAKLGAFVEGRELEEGYRGEAQRNKEALSIFNSDELLKGAVRTWVEQGEYAKLLSLWVKGLAVDWSALYPHAAPKRVSLSTYPFARERHWLDARSSDVAVRTEPSAVLHPLLHHNTSTVRGQRFSATLSGDELFLADHRVAGRRTLPGVAYLEMARAAVAMSLEDEDQEAMAVELGQVVWLRPLQIEHAQDVHIRLHENDRRELEFEIYTTQPDATGAKQAVVHAQGHARSLARRQGAEAIDLRGVRDRCEHAVDVAELYAAFSAMGIEYGPAHRALTSVQVGTGPDGQRFVLAQVTLPATMSEAAAPYVLHPSILDGALQASMALSLGNATAPMLPFALERLQILDRSPASAWIVIRGADKLEIDICDEAGRPCVRMQGFSARPVRGTQEAPASRAEREVPRMEGTVSLAPRWEARPLPETAAWPGAASRVVLVGGTPQQQQAWRQRYAQLHVLQIATDTSVNRVADEIAACAGVDHVVWLAPVSAPSSVADEALIEGQEAGVIGLYRLIKALLRSGYGARPLGLTVVTWRSQAVERGEWIDPTHAGVHGLIGSLAKEYEEWKVRLVDGSPADAAFLDHLLRAPADPNGDAWVYRAGEWYRQQLIACELGAPPEAPYRQGGVYVVIGGAGGIGEVLSEHLIRNHGARLVWLGRSAMSAAIEAKIARLAKLGPAPMYLACDA